MSKDDTKARKVVAEALDLAFKNAQKQESEEGQQVLDIQTAKYIIFSDHHKGNRNGADDFRVCERAYNAALAYYYRLGYTLIVLGDAEELWEERPKTVLKAYAHTLELEGMFNKAGQYLRFWGNHDDDWSRPNLVENLLIPALGGGSLKVRESLIFHVKDGENELGKIFLTHGHQGTLESDRIAPLSKILVRYFWRPIQRIIKFSFNTPAKDFRLRHAHDSAMYYWSEEQDKVVLIAGHTHRPVFKSEPHDVVIRGLLADIEAKLAIDPDNPELKQQMAYHAANLEWILAQNQQSSQLQVIELTKPSYFNTGCCSFVDGDITGLEISHGEFRLVRWPDEEENPKPKYLECAKLEEIFAKC